MPSHEAVYKCNSSRVHHAHNPQHHQHQIGHLLDPGLRDPLVVQVRRVHVHERDAGHAADEGDEAVQVRAPGDGDGAAEAHEAGPEGVLLPLGEDVLLAAAVAEELALEDAHGGEELDGVADEHGEGVHELHGVDELRVLREVVDDLDLRVRAESGVAERADRGEDASDDEHDDAQQLLELLGGAHRRVDGDDEAYTLEGEDGRADGEGVRAGVEEPDGWLDSVVGEVPEVELPDVAEPDQDEYICEGGGEAQLGDVADEAQRDEQQRLECDEGLGAEGVGAVGDGSQEAKPVVRHEDQSRAHESQL